MNNLSSRFLRKKTKRALIKFFLTCASLLPLGASLMMSKEELNVLNVLAPTDDLNPIEILKTTAPEPVALKMEPVEHILFVSAILYFNQDQWTVWINDKTYTIDYNEDQYIKIVRVSNDQVQLELKNANQKIVRLRANQSLVPVCHNIIDGDARRKDTEQSDMALGDVKLKTNAVLL